MEPITAALAVGGGAALAGGIMQYYNSQKAMKASKERLAQIEALYNQIVPPQYDVKVYDSPELLNNIPAPAFDASRIDPVLFKSVGQYVPEIAPYAKQLDPETIKASANAQAGRAAQMSALQKYRDIANQSTDPELANALFAAQRQAGADAQGREASVMEQAARRGQTNSAATLAAQIQAGQGAMDQEAVASRQAALEQYKNRLLGLDRFAELGGQIRGSEMSEAGRNADIINQFNNQTSQRYQTWLNSQADTRNAAQRYNLGNDQDIANRNVDLNNTANQNQRQMQNAGALQTANWNQGQRQFLEGLQEQKQNVQSAGFNNELAIAGGKSGVANNQVNNMNLGVANQNQAIQGAGSGILAGTMSYGKYNSPTTKTVGGYNVTGRDISDPDDDETWRTT